VGIDTIHDGLSRVKLALNGWFSDENSKKRVKGAALAALLALKPGR
jgi:hypothetical protein